MISITALTECDSLQVLTLPVITSRTLCCSAEAPSLPITPTMSRSEDADDLAFHGGDHERADAVLGEHIHAAVARISSGPSVKNVVALGIENGLHRHMRSSRFLLAETVTRRAHAGSVRHGAPMPPAIQGPGEDEAARRAAQPRLRRGSVKRRRSRRGRRGSRRQCASHAIGLSTPGVKELSPVTRLTIIHTQGRRRRCACPARCAPAADRPGTAPAFVRSMRKPKRAAGRPSCLRSHRKRRPAAPGRGGAGAKCSAAAATDVPPRTGRSAASRDDWRAAIESRQPTPVDGKCSMPPCSRE